MRQIHPLLILCAALPALCQPSFTVASVKRSTQEEGTKPSIRIDPGRASYTNVSLQTLITKAYDLGDYQVSGPSWLNSDRFTVLATMPETTTLPEVAQMLRSLLVERFQLKLRRTEQEAPVYLLTVGKNGAKLKQSEGGEMTTRFKRGGLMLHNARMANLTGLLTSLLDRPVVDRTELKDTYDLSLEFAPDPGLGRMMAKMTAEAAASGADASAGPSIFTAVQEQLGLKLDPRKAPVEMLVVDSAARTPVEN